MNQSARLPEAWNRCPRCRGIDAHLPWNTQGVSNAMDWLRIPKKKPAEASFGGRPVRYSGEVYSLLPINESRNMNRLMKSR